MVLGCIICHEPFDRSTDAVIASCGHVFDRECVNQWIRTQGTRTCPTCRMAIPENGLKLCYFTVLSDANQSTIPTSSSSSQNQPQTDDLVAITMSLNSQIEELMKDRRTTTTSAGSNKFKADNDLLKRQIEKYKKDIQDSQLAYNNVISMMNADFKKYTEEKQQYKNEIRNLKNEIGQLTQMNHVLSKDKQKLNERHRIASLHEPYHKPKTTTYTEVKIHTCSRLYEPPPPRPKCTCCKYQEL